jgi:hypothetical protein
MGKSAQYPDPVTGEVDYCLAPVSPFVVSNYINPALATYAYVCKIDVEPEVWPEIADDFADNALLRFAHKWNGDENWEAGLRLCARYRFRGV